MIDYDYGVSLDILKSECLEDYQGFRNHKDIRRWCRQTNLIDELEQDQWFARQSADPTIQMFEVLDDAGALVGVCGLTDINHHCQRAEFSLYIEKDCQGVGLGLAALRTLIEFGFKDLNLNMRWGETVGDNPGARVFEKAGFQKTGYRPCFYYKDGEFQDSHIYCLLRA